MKFVEKIIESASDVMRVKCFFSMKENISSQYTALFSLSEISKLSLDRSFFCYIKEERLQRSPVCFMTSNSFTLEDMNQIQHTPVRVFGVSNKAFLFHDRECMSIFQFWGHDLTHAFGIKAYLSLKSMFVSELISEIKLHLDVDYGRLFEHIDFCHHEDFIQIFLSLALNPKAFNGLDVLIDRLNLSESFEYDKDNPLQVMFYLLNPSEKTMPYDLVEEMKSMKQDKDKQIRFFRELKRIFPDAIEVAYLKSVKRLEALSKLS